MDGWSKAFWDTVHLQRDIMGIALPDCGLLVLLLLSLLCGGWRYRTGGCSFHGSNWYEGLCLHYTFLTSLGFETWTHSKGFAVGLAWGS
jgi:hypothetical protein